MKFAHAVWSCHPWHLHGQLFLYPKNLFPPPLSVSHLLPSPVTLCPRQQISPLFDTIVLPLLPFLYKRSHRVCGPLCPTLSFRAILFLIWPSCAWSRLTLGTLPYQEATMHLLFLPLSDSPHFPCSNSYYCGCDHLRAFECAADHLALSQCCSSRLALGHLSSYTVDWSPREGMASESHILGIAYC